MPGGGASGVLGPWAESGSLGGHLFPTSHRGAARLSGCCLGYPASALSPRSSQGQWSPLSSLGQCCSIVRSAHIVLICPSTEGHSRSRLVGCCPLVWLLPGVPGLRPEPPVLPGPVVTSLLSGHVGSPVSPSPLFAPSSVLSFSYCTPLGQCCSIVRSAHIVLICPSTEGHSRSRLVGCCPLVWLLPGVPGLRPEPPVLPGPVVTSLLSGAVLFHCTLSPHHAHLSIHGRTLAFPPRGTGPRLTGRIKEATVLRHGELEGACSRLLGCSDEGPGARPTARPRDSPPRTCSVQGTRKP
ncbi:uncharacterized protein LOC135321365 [Camelus dromedarius]|uniref:uncharacterized protein LOC135321365 n=1 Tax=Camelus dromedarius TaxID=9838 RepID=UPI0031195214